MMFGRKRRESWWKSMPRQWRSVSRQLERRQLELHDEAWNWQASMWDWQRRNHGVPVMRGVITRDSQHIVWNGPMPGGATGGYEVVEVNDG